MASIANETGWTFKQILWEHTEDQIDGYLYGSSSIGHKISEKYKTDDKGKPKVKMKVPETKEEYDDLDRRIKAMQNQKTVFKRIDK